VLPKLKLTYTFFQDAESDPVVLDSEKPDHRLFPVWPRYLQLEGTYLASRHPMRKLLSVQVTRTCVDDNRHQATVSYKVKWFTPNS